MLLYPTQKKTISFSMLGIDTATFYDAIAFVRI